MVSIEVYEVDTSVPLPELKAPSLLTKLEVGESFLFPFTDRKKVQSYASQLKKRVGKEFTVQKQGEFCRAWRVK